MLLIAKPLQFEANRPIIVLNKDDAEELDVKALERVEVSFDSYDSFGILFNDKGEIE